MRILYNLLLLLLVPAVVARLAWRGIARPAYLARWPERFGRGPARPRPGGIWIHAVSVGEVVAAAPLVERLLQRLPGVPVTVTTMTPTGSERATRLLGDRVDHCYVPYDLPWAVNRFLARLRPRAAVIMETELWPNLFHRCAARRVAVVLANARMSARSARRYRRIAGLVTPALRHLAAVAAQSDADAGRLVALGAPPDRVRVTGSVKFDITLADTLAQQASALRSRFGQRPVWIAGSTHDGEERAVLQAHVALRRRWPDLLLVLVPRHPERFGQVAALTRSQRLSLARRSDLDDPAAVAVYLGDTMGELQLLYATADVAFVGGSLVPVGGHNLLEPAALGVPVVTGPHLHNFEAIAELLFEAGAAGRVDDVAGLVDGVAVWLADPARRRAAGDAGQRVVARNRGALERLEQLVLETLRVA